MTEVRYHPTAAQLLDDASKVKPYANNPRNGDVEAIVASIREVGCYRPIYVWTKTGEILAGNHTYAALMELGQDRVPIAWVEAETMAEARKIVLGDNRMADLGRYDEALLLAELEALDGDLTGTGFIPDDLDSIRAMMDTAAWEDDRGRQGAHDEPDEESFNPRIDLRVTSRVFDAWRQMLDAQDGADDAAKLEAHLAEGGWIVGEDAQ
jgi:hypothetical protein